MAAGQETLLTAKVITHHAKRKKDIKIERAIVDSGANTMLMRQDAPLVEGGKVSNRKCWDFTGQKYAAMSKEGSTWMCFTDPSDSSYKVNESQTMKVWTQTAKQITDQILSVPRMVKAHGYDCSFKTTGWEGFTKTNPVTGYTTRIPVTWDEDDYLWYIYFTMGDTKASAMRRASRQDRVHRQVVDVTGNDYEPSICYVGNMMLRRSRRQRDKEKQEAAEATAPTQTAPKLDAHASDKDPAVIPTEAPDQEDSRRGTIIDGQPTQKGMSIMDTQLFKQNESLVRPSLRPHDLKLNQEQRHAKLGHFGYHKNCVHCQQVKLRPRQVYKNPTPVYDHVPGRSIHMDSMYVDVQSRHGDWYCAPGWDDCTGYLDGIFMGARSEAGDAIVNWVIKHRTNPELKCPEHFCTIIYLDPAGEWSRKCPGFMQKMTDNNIDVRSKPVNVDKRGLGKGEMAVQISKMHMQAIMLSTRLEEDMWREAIEYAWHVHNLLCLTRNASPKGNGPRPLTQISDNNIDAEECDRRKDYSIPPGSLALVHKPGKHGGAYDLTNSRYGRAIRMDRDICVFETLDDRRDEFDSKHFAVLPLEPGVSALRKYGCERKLRLPKACLPRDDRPKHITVVQLSYIYHGESELELPTVKSIIATTDERLPTMLTMDATGRILEQQGNILRPTDGFCMIVPAAEVTLEMKDKQITYHKEAVTARPKWFIGWPVHKRFEEWKGVCRGYVKSYDNDEKYWKVLWEPDQKYTEFDVDDMYNYAIDLIDGKSEADGGHALMLRARQKSIWGGGENQPVPAASEIATADPNWHSTNALQSWTAICAECKVPSNQQREYLMWIRDNHKLGNREEFKADDAATFFPSPLKTNKRKVNQMAFTNLVKAGTRFPRIDGEDHSESWQRHVRYTNAESRRGDRDHSRTERESRIAFMRVAVESTSGRPSRKHYYENCMNSYHIEVEQTNTNHQLERQLRISFASDRPNVKTWAEIEAEYKHDGTRVDKSTGLPIPPKSMKELDTWPDGTIKDLWDEAGFKEWMGLNGRDCFRHDVTEEVLKAEGLIPKHKIVGMRMLYDAKSRDGLFDKAKGRCIVQGHKGSIRRGIDYDTVFAAAPHLETQRMLMALYAGLGWTSFVYDINQAYLIGTAEQDQRYPLRYPEGPIRDAHRDKNGKERYMILQGNVYGVPTAARVFAKERDRLMLEEIPRRTGWTVKTLMYESCIYKIQTDNGCVLISTHTDDCDCLAEHPEDAKRVIDECNKLFAHKGADGITVGGNDFLLGSSRKKKIINGVRYITISQVAKINEMWNLYKDKRSGCRTPKQPYPSDNEHPDLNDQLQAEDVDESEWKDVIENEDYRQITGSLLWIMRNSMPALMYGTSITTKCMCKPSQKALKSAMQLMHYAHETKEMGITFNSHGNLEPICYIDSGFNQAKLGSKPQYSFVIMWMGGPIVWKSKRHDQVPLSVSEAEFMTLTHAYIWIKWVREMIRDLGFPEWVERPTLTLTDNRNARDWANETMITDGNRHIDRRYMLIREKVNMGIMAVVWESGDWNISDLGTKPTDTPTNTRLVPIICGQEELPIPAGQKVLFGPVDKPVRRESTNLAIALKELIK